jgi:hypothetical protein
MHRTVGVQSGVYISRTIKSERVDVVPIDRKCYAAIVGGSMQKQGY